MKERPILFSGPMVRALLSGGKTQTRRLIKPQPAYINSINLPQQEDNNLIRCQYGQPGDRLWVRETWMDLYGTGVEVRTGDSSRYAYRADTPAGSYGDEQRKLYGLKWRPSIYMPRAVSRITLDVVSVHVQRLQDISETDALEEGIQHSTLNDPRVEYRWLMESINGADAWDGNPWVWVIEFKRVEVGAA